MALDMAVVKGPPPLKQKKGHVQDGHRILCRGYVLPGTRAQYKGFSEILAGAHIYPLVGVRQKLSVTLAWWQDRIREMEARLTMDVESVQLWLDLAP